MQKSFSTLLVVGALGLLGGACSSGSVYEGPAPQYVPVPMGVANGYWVAVDENRNGVYDEGDGDIEACEDMRGMLESRMMADGGMRGMDERRGHDDLRAARLIGAVVRPRGQRDSRFSISCRQCASFRRTFS